VRERYALYRECAETEHYANYNWFDRPQWTEACAVVDSLLLAIELWRATGEAEYLTTAHHVYFNALSYAQRPNGGFGCDLCPGADGRIHLGPHPEIFEAPWCCSMRGAEGLVRAAQAGMMIEGAKRTVWQAFYFEGETTLRLPDGEAVVRVTSEYPHAGSATWTVVSSTLKSPVTWSFFVPPGVVASALVLNTPEPKPARMESARFVSVPLMLSSGATWTVTMPLNVTAERPGNPSRWIGYNRFACGPLLLGAEDTTEGTVALSPEESFQRAMTLSSRPGAGPGRCTTQRPLPCAARYRK